MKSQGAGWGTLVARFVDYYYPLSALKEMISLLLLL